MSAGALLLRCFGPATESDALSRDLGGLAAGNLQETQNIAAYTATENDAQTNGRMYVYLNLRDSSDIAAQAARIANRLTAATREFPTLKPMHIKIAPLELVFDAPGASRDEDSPFHYIVETDVVPEHEADLVAWYDTEHMPGLAACPGSVRARRFRNTNGSPRYHSCYDLVRTEAFGSEPWLAVRNSKWSDRVRPHFRNTRRTMFRRLFDFSL